MNLFSTIHQMGRLLSAALLLSALSAFGQANLQPYAPGGWTYPVVVTTNNGSTTQSPTMNTANTLYVDWCVANQGNLASTAFNVSIYVDGVLNQTWSSGSLNPSSYTYVNSGYSIGALSAGNHAIVMTISPNNVSYTNNITVTAGAAPLPNLTPYQISGWSSPLVIATNLGATTQSPLFSTTNTVYVNWAVINNGNAAAGAFTTSLYVDGVQKFYWNNASLGIGYYTYITDYSIGTLSAGTHTLVITADSSNTVAESDEADNSYTNIITVTQAAAPPAPVLSTPANGSTGQPTTPAFSWSAVPSVTGYRLIVATSAADLPTDPNASSGGPSVVLDTVVTNNSDTLSVPINPGTTYYWKVHARDLGGDDGTWSSVFSFTTGVTLSGLTIVPSFDSTITSDPHASGIESTINAAIAVYEADFSDAITVHITFSEMSSGLGLSSSSSQTFTYASYRAALVSHATTTDDATALAYLPNTTANPVNGNTSVELQLPLARALGFSGANPSPGQPDGTIYLNTGIMNLSGATMVATNYALFSVVSHEIDEVLGLTSVLDGLSNNAATPTGPADPEDLFRYDGTGARTLSTAANATSYFSLNGTTDLAQFNQHQGGDFHDWYSYPSGAATPEVQDAYSTPGVTPVLGVELRALDAVGFTRVVAQDNITASAGSGGTVSPSGTFSVNPGTNQLFTASPDGTHFVSQWLLDAAVAQNGGSNYTLVNVQGNHTVQVTFLAKTNQTITFGALASQTLGEPAFGVAATASSGLPVAFSILSGPATVAGTNITLTGTGTVTVQAAQAGNTNFNAAPSVNQSFIVYPRPGIGLATAGTNLIFSWSTNVAGFALYSTTNLAGVISWSPVTPAPVVVNGQNVLSNAITGKQKFYRLMK